MNKSIKVSVIIPVYNVENYLKQCLDSVLNQTHSNLEIILVDDGSTDLSSKICDEYKNKDNRIIVIHKENGGLSSARNVGLEIATGKYIVFVDSDDFIDNKLVMDSINVLELTKADVCMFSHYITDGEIHNPQILPLNQDIYEDNELKTKIIPLFIGQNTPNESPLLGFVWRQIFKRSSISDLRFKSEREFYAEDVVFDLEFYCNANKMCVINKPYYYYRYVESSLSNKYRKNLFEKLIKLVNFKKEIIDKFNIENCTDRINRSVFRAVIGSLINVKKAPDLSKKQKKEQIKNIIQNELVKTSIKKVKTKGVKEKVLMLLIKMKLSGLILTLI